MSASEDEAIWERLRRKHRETVRDAYAEDGRIEFQCGVGWAALIDGVFTTAGEVLSGTGQQLRVLQIKQKLGGLRIAVDDLPPDAMTAVSRAMQEAEFLSFATCETCGGRGRLMVDRLGWWATRCAAHAPPGARPNKQPLRRVFQALDGRRLLWSVGDG
jgi:hypothetical protein